MAHKCKMDSKSMFPVPCTCTDKCPNCGGMGEVSVSVPCPECRGKSSVEQVLERAEGFISGFEDDETQKGVKSLLRDLRRTMNNIGAMTSEPAKVPRVLIEINGGNVEVLLSDGPVDVKLYDWDNIECSGESNDPKAELERHPYSADDIGQSAMQRAINDAEKHLSALKAKARS